MNNNLSTEENRAEKIKICHRSHGTKEGQVLSVSEGDTGQLHLRPDIMDWTKPGKVNLPPNMVFAWGMCTSNQLGQADDEYLWEPALMNGKQLETRSGVMVAAGGQHTLLLATYRCDKNL